MLKRIRTAILSRSRLFREAIARRLGSESTVELVAVAQSPRELLAAARAPSVEVLLIHSTTSAWETADGIWQIKAALPKARVIVLGPGPSEAEVLRCIEAGAVAYLEDDVAYELIPKTIQAVTSGRAACPAALLACIARRIGQLRGLHAETAPCHWNRLSERETEVARLVGAGLVNKQIARRLCVKPSTVKKHVHNIMHKLDIQRRRELIRQVYEGGTG